MKKKLELSIFIVGVSTRMGIHAERAWWNAFRRNHWEVYPSSDEVSLGINNYQGRRSSTDHDIDFVAKKDSISYGVEVKNGLNYPNDLYWKFSVSAELDTIPLIIARWLNPAQIPLIEDLGGTKPLVYKDGIYATTYQQLVSEARQILNAPIEARDEVEDPYFHKKLDPIHQDTLTNFAAKQAKIKGFLLRRRTESSIRGILGTGQ